jgi:zinc/manganese transport system substrate-binding protein
MKFSVRLTVLALVAATLSACGSSSTPGGVISVIAAENFWGNIISQIGGTHVRVTSIISDPNADPHEYETSARNAAAVARARLVFENGLGYDDFMSKLLSVSAKSSRAVLSAQQILDVGGDNPNPHIWYDTARLPQVATAIATELSALDPADASTFKANGATFVLSLEPILSVIDQIKAKYAGVNIAYTERVPGYLIEAAGLKLGVPSTFTQAVEDGNDPSPTDTEKFDTAISHKTVKVLLYNAQVTDPATDRIKALAKSSGVPVVGVTETLPVSDKTFQAWQLRQASELLTALGG